MKFFKTKPALSRKRQLFAFVISWALCVGIVKAIDALTPGDEHEAFNDATAPYFNIGLALLLHCAFLLLFNARQKSHVPSIETGVFLTSLQNGNMPREEVGIYRSESRVSFAYLLFAFVLSAGISVGLVKLIDTLTPGDQHELMKDVTAPYLNTLASLLIFTVILPALIYCNNKCKFGNSEEIEVLQQLVSSP